jgi:hypothetical protein
MKLLRRLVTEVREVNSGDHMAEGGLTTDKAPEQTGAWEGGLRRDVGRECGASYLQVA